MLHDGRYNANFSNDSWRCSSSHHRLQLRATWETSQEIFKKDFILHSHDWNFINIRPTSASQITLSEQKPIQIDKFFRCPDVSNINFIVSRCKELLVDFFSADVGPDGHKLISRRARPLLRATPRCSGSAVELAGAALFWICRLGWVSQGDHCRNFRFSELTGHFRRQYCSWCNGVMTHHLKKRRCYGVLVSVRHHLRVAQNPLGRSLKDAHNETDETWGPEEVEPCGARCHDQQRHAAEMAGCHLLCVWCSHKAVANSRLD